MSKARRTEGPRAPLFYGALLTAAVLPASVSSQEVALRDLEACAALSDDAEKIACFNAIIAAEQADAVPPAPPPGAESDSAPTPAAGTLPDRTPAAVNAAAAEETSAAPAATRTPVTPVATSPAAADNTPAERPDPAPAAETMAPPAEAKPEAVPAAVPAASVDIGREQLEQAQSAVPERVQATVVDVTRAYNDALIFHLDNGQVWRQIEPRRYPYPRNGAFAVTISQGMMGEYRMRIGDNGRMVRIRRIR